MFYLFPNGAGAISIILFIIAFFGYKIIRLNAAKKTIVSFMILISIYTIIGCVVFFRSPFKETGDVYFSTKIDEELLAEKVSSINSANDFVDLLFPKSEKMKESLIELENGQLKKYIYKYYNSKNTRVTITVTLLDDENLLREEYLNEIGNEKKLRYLLDERDFQVFDNKTKAFCIFPIAFDGTKFMLPFVDSSGANFNAYFYFGDSYVIISESANNIYDLITPQYLNKFMT